MSSGGAWKRRLRGTSANKSCDDGHDQGSVGLDEQGSLFVDYNSLHNESARWCPPPFLYSLVSERFSVCVALRVEFFIEN